VHQIAEIRARNSEPDFGQPLLDRPKFVRPDFDPTSDFEPDLVFDRESDFGHDREPESGQPIFDPPREPQPVNGPAPVLPVVAVLSPARGAVDDHLPDEIHVDSPEHAALRRGREAAEATRQAGLLAGRRWSTRPQWTVVPIHLHRRCAGGREL
jgi:hypothetical protein